jgi:hypothetical protein
MYEPVQGRFGFTYSPLPPSGWKTVNERNDPVPVVAREQALQFLCHALRIRAKPFQLAINVSISVRASILAAASRRSRMLPGR